MPKDTTYTLRINSKLKESLAVATKNTEGPSPHY